VRGNHADGDATFNLAYPNRDPKRYKPKREQISKKSLEESFSVTSPNNTFVETYCCTFQKLKERGNPLPCAGFPQLQRLSMTQDLLKKQKPTLPKAKSIRTKNRITHQNRILVTKIKRGMPRQPIFQSSLLRNCFCKSNAFSYARIESCFQSSLLRNCFCKTWYYLVQVWIRSLSILVTEELLLQASQSHSKPHT
jgi:hypothetical protein